MPRRILAACLAVCLMLSGAAMAANANLAEAEYEKIVNVFNEAISEDTDEKDALDLFAYIVESYEENEAVQDDDRAFLYYAYAYGRLLFEEEDYSTAAEMFDYCGSLQDAVEYKSFSNGMFLKQSGAYDVDMYQEAITAFEVARNCEAIASKSGKQISECRKLYKESLLALGDEAFERKDYEVALGYYEKLKNQLDADGLQRYNQCLEKLSDSQKPQVEITSNKSLAPDRTEVGFTTALDTVVVSLHIQPGTPVTVRKPAPVDAGTEGRVELEATLEDNQGWSVSNLPRDGACAVCFLGLLPNTQYLVRFSDSSGKKVLAEDRFRTAGAEQSDCFSAQEIDICQYGIATYNSALNNLKPGVSIWYALSVLRGSEGCLQPLPDTNIAVGNAALNTTGYCLFITVAPGGLTHESLSGKVGQVVLHIDELGTVATPPFACGESDSLLSVVQEGKDGMALEITGLLGQAVGKYPDLAGKGFVIECLLDGMQLLDLYRSIHIRVLICAVARKNETIIPTVRIEGKPLPESQLRGVYVYMSVYLLLMAVSMLLLSAQGFDMTTTITSVITCLNNIGPGLEVVGPMGNFSGYSLWAKLLLSFDMLAGRLEIFPMLLLFAPSIWKGRKQSK